MDITYKIVFFSDWHCGSGLSSGADLDLLVIKDKNKLPFIPGKTIKGLIKEALEDIKEFDEKYADMDLEKLLGSEAKKKKDGEGEMSFDKQGCCFFTNVELEKELKTHIADNHLQEYLYHTIASTAIGEDGVAEEHSLRKMEVTVPCELTGEILDVPDGYLDLFKDALLYIKRLGQNRNRGLGRCSIEIVSPKVIKEELS
ncbi:MAG: RAMP superfamily CRISPR-associated protein [Dysgonamonadaceae bacterium]|jgi:CRISPR/Cas system CSM-associated protein Csm3 (group 7 of RAMP superfamily)|nr:RAMP superfamily CRISPR-associated protein [Dysgonamonadaceae bacterium]